MEYNYTLYISQTQLLMHGLVSVHIKKVVVTSVPSVLGNPKLVMTYELNTSSRLEVNRIRQTDQLR